MMNGSNLVLDNWEEIDEDRLTNQLDQIKIEQEQQGSRSSMPYQEAVTADCNSSSFLIGNNDESKGGRYTSKPVVKILRRPTQEQNKKNNDKPKQPIKTLQQREQEYAEARLRILGAAKNPEDELETALEKKLQTKLLSETSTNLNNNNNNNNNNNDNDSLNEQSIPSSSQKLSPQNQLLNGILRPQENIIRNPKGPDGTKGFNIRR